MTALLSAGFLFGMMLLMNQTAEPLLGQYRLGALFLLFMAALAFEPLRLHVQHFVSRWILPSYAGSQALAGALAQSEQFREDVYWRINGAEIKLPPLRERSADIPLLAAFFLNQATALTVNGRPRSLSESAQHALVKHAWPGNLRELRHEMQRASVLVGERQVIEAADFAFLHNTARDTEKAKEEGTLSDKLEALERREIERALAKYHGNRTHAAEALGITRRGLLKKMSRFGFS